MTTIENHLVRLGDIINSYLMVNHIMNIVTYSCQIAISYFPFHLTTLKKFCMLFQTKSPRAVISYVSKVMFQNNQGF